MDVNFIIRQGTIYAAMVAVITIIYALIVVGWQEIIMRFLPVAIDPVAAAALTGGVIALGYRPLEEHLKRITAKIFHLGRYDYQQIINQVADRISSLHDMPVLGQVLTDVLTGQLGLAGAAFLEYQDRLGGFKAIAQSALAGDEYLSKKEFDSDHPLIYVLDQTREPIVAEEWERLLDEKNLSALERVPRQMAVQEMRAHKIALAVPILLQDKVLGQLFLGDKVSGGAFSRQDLGLLATLVNQTALVMENIILYEQAQNNERLSSLGALSASLAEEIDRPLSEIRKMTGQLAGRISETDFLREFSRVVPDQIQKLFDLVMDLLRYARPAPAEYRLVSLNQLIQNALQLMQQEMKNCSVKVDLVLDRLLPQVEADPEQLAQVLIGLGLNSAQAIAGQGGGELTLATSLGSFRDVNSNELKERVILTLTDTGPGFSPAETARLFDPFFQTAGRKLGLGLATVRRIIEEKHHGRILVDSLPGRGTTFKIYLPLLQPRRGYLFDRQPVVAEAY